jgi:inward rectifier potassium channel
MDQISRFPKKAADVTSSAFSDPPIVTGSVTEEPQKDFGFGPVVASSTEKRLLNRDGTFNVVRYGLNPLSALSFFHWSLSVSWPVFLAFLSASYLAINTVFAFAFMACGPGALTGMTAQSVGGEFFRAFFFSVETFATIGYGNIVPIGIPANILVTLEALLNIVSIALATGIVFARFSRPTAKIVYSHRALVGPYRSGSAFEFRIANARTSQIIELEAKVSLSRLEPSADGKVRKFHDLKLERNKVVFFPLSWTLVHSIDPSSPLSGWTSSDLIAADAEFLILLTGIDEAYSQTVHSRSSYKADEVVWNAKFGSVFRRSQKHGILGMDITRLHDIESVF